MTPRTITDINLAQTLHDVLFTEAAALHRFAQKSDPNLIDAVRMIDTHKGPLIVAGVGKSGHIARKIASTFCSLGKPSVFLHASEASHGDLGLIASDSVVLLLSNSGETTELSDLLHFCRTHKIPMIAITSRKESTLAQFSDIALIYGQAQEACINGLAPTTSTTLSLAIGDALAVGTSLVMGVEPHDFRRYHPGGKLGERLVTAGQVMRKGDALPTVDVDMAMTDAVIVMTEKSLGTALVLEQDRVCGIITDGDLRRAGTDFWKMTAGQVATRDPVRIAPETLVSEAVALMNENGINSCVVEHPDGNLAGLLHIHDCLASRS